MGKAQLTKKLLNAWQLKKGVDKSLIEEYCMHFKDGLSLDKAIAEVKNSDKSPGRRDTVIKIQQAVKDGKIKFDDEGLPQLPAVLPWETDAKEKKSTGKTTAVKKGPEAKAQDSALSAIGKAVGDTANTIVQDRIDLGEKLEKVLTPFAYNHGFKTLDDYVISCCSFYEENRTIIEVLKNEAAVRDAAIDYLIKAKRQLEEQCQPIQVEKHRLSVIGDFLTKVYLLRAQGVAVPESLVSEFKAVYGSIADGGN